MKIILLLFKKCTNKTVKRFQMKSTGCRDGQHTGLQSTQTRRNYSSNNTHRRRKRGARWAVAPNNFVATK